MSERVLRRLWIVALIVLLAVGAAVLWVVFSGSDEQPTLTFDGTAATDSGPVTPEAGLGHVQAREHL